MCDTARLWHRNRGEQPTLGLGVNLQEVVLGRHVTLENYVLQRPAIKDQMRMVWAGWQDGSAGQLAWLSRAFLAEMMQPLHSPLPVPTPCAMQLWSEQPSSQPIHPGPPLLTA